MATTMEVPWASAIREFNPLCANVLLYWHMVRFAIERGFRTFDFGRSTPGEGTFHFKRQWGAEPRELVWEYWTADGRPLPDLNPKNPKFGLAISAWQRLPVPVATDARTAGSSVTFRDRPCCSLLACRSAALVYVYAGYPLLLRLIVRLRGRAPGAAGPTSRRRSAWSSPRTTRPPSSAASSRTRCRSTIPRDAAARSSSSRTPRRWHRRDRVAGSPTAACRLARQDERRGKTAGLNRTVPHAHRRASSCSPTPTRCTSRTRCGSWRATSPIPTVGCVTGEARYLPAAQRAADVGERAYWDYEIQIKRLETALGSMVGGDGAIYAIRRSLWRSCPTNAINDFLNPLQIVAAGWRAVYEPEAICYEETAGGMRHRVPAARAHRQPQLARRVPGAGRAQPVPRRAVQRGRWSRTRCCAGCPGIRRPGGRSARWHSPSAMSSDTGPMLALGVAAARRRQCHHRHTPWATASSVLLAYFAVISTRVAGRARERHRSAGFPGVWSTPRERSAPAGATSRRLIVPVGAVLHGMRSRLVVAPRRRWRPFRCAPIELCAFCFWASGERARLRLRRLSGRCSLLCSAVATRPVRLSAIEPSVCVFIAANDEAAVIEAQAAQHAGARLPGRPARDRRGVRRLDRRHQRHRPALRAARAAARVVPAPGQDRHDQRRRCAPCRAKSSSSRTPTPSSTQAPSAPLVRNFADERVGAVSGDVVLIGERAALGAIRGSLLPLRTLAAASAESRIGSMIGADGALYAIRRELFAPPPDDTILDDMAIPMAVVRAGRRVVFEPEAHGLRTGLRNGARRVLAQVTRHCGRHQFLQRRDSSVPLTSPQVILSLVSHKALRWLSPAFATCAFVSSAVLAPASYVYAAAVAGQLVLLALGLAGCAPALRKFAPIGIAHYFCLTQMAAAAGFVRGLTRRQSVLWQRFARTSRSAPLAVSK